MAGYLGLKRRERAKPEERVDYRNGFYQRSYVTALGMIELRIPRTPALFSAALHGAAPAAPAGSCRTDPAGVSAGHFHAPGGLGGGIITRSRLANQGALSADFDEMLSL